MPTPSTTDIIQIKEIVDGAIVLKDDTLRAVIEISAINFELRSSDEQAALIQQFQGFLNAIDFPIQMIVHSRKFDISGYIASVKEASAAVKNELLQVQAQEYVRFVTELSELSNIMSKKFYVVLPFTAAPASTDGKKGGFFSGITGMFSKKPATPAAPAGIAPATLSASKVQLQQRADLIIAGLSGMGLRGMVLEQKELIVLFNDLYNPIVPATKKEATA